MLESHVRIWGKSCDLRMGWDVLQRCWAESVEPEAFSSMHHSEFPRHSQHGALASCVRELRSCATYERYDARGVDHARLLLPVLAEAQNSVLAAEPHALDVDVLGQVPDLLGGVDGV